MTSRGKTAKKTGSKVSIAEKPRVRSVRSGKAEKLKSYVKPMLASIHDKPFSNPEWIFEVKWDGYRAIAEKKGTSVKLYSRNGLSFNGIYPKVVSALEALEGDFILDGEIVVLNEEGQSDFQMLQQYGDFPKAMLIFYVFDCLAYNGKSFRHLPLLERKAVAEKVVTGSEVIRYSNHIQGEGEQFFQQVAALNMEGMIAKDASSQYVDGKRSKDWLKIKHHSTQEAIIVGYTAPRGSRAYFGALVLAVREQAKLKYIGHTGTGFTQKSLRDLFEKLKPLKREKSVFDHKIPMQSTVTWVEPKLVAAIKFTEATADGMLRHPVFMGLRIDKETSEVGKLDPIATSNTNKGTPNKETRLIHGREIQLTNLTKLYFPEDKITKGHVIKYYNAIHRYLLPHLKDKPQSLRRNPNGIHRPSFFQKDAGDHVPGWIKTEPIYAESADRTIDYIICNNLETLLYMSNLGCIEINPWNSRIGKLDCPDYLVIDIDPSDNNTFDEVVETALVVHDILERAGAPNFCKTSGASGLHVYVPMKAQYDYEQVRSFAELIATLTVQELGKTTTIERSIKNRNGKIYVDYLQNKKGQTVASVYSVRPKSGATVSTPLHWKEVRAGLQPTDFNIRNVLKRVEKEGDVFQEVLTSKTNIKQCLKNLNL